MIICLGTTPALQRTLTFDRLATGDVNRAKSVSQFASGKSVNVARVLHVLSERCIATGLVGGENALLLREDLRRASVSHDFVDTPAPTRMCQTLLNESDKTATELIEEPTDPGPDAYDDLLAKLAVLLADRATALVLSGSLAPGAGDDFYAGCIRLANDANVPTILDAVGSPLKLALAEHPNVVKPNRAELESTLGITINCDDSLHDAMKHIVKLGARWIVVSDGEKPVHVSNGETIWRVTIPKITPVSPIGSGDALCAGIAAGISRNLNIPQAAALGVACAAANALTPHAGHVNKLAVDMLRKQVEVALDVPPLPPRL